MRSQYGLCDACRWRELPRPGPSRPVHARLIGDSIGVVSRDVEHMSDEQLVSVREQSRVEENEDRYEQAEAEIRKRRKARRRLRARQSA